MLLKRILVLALSTALAVSLTACGSSGGSSAAPAASGSNTAAAATEGAAAQAPAAPVDNLELSFACSGNLDGTMQGDIIYKYIDLLAEWSGGSLTIGFYPNAQLGGDVEIIEGTQLGSISIFNGAPTAQIGLIPELALLDIPGLFSTMEACNEVLSGDFKDMIQEYYNKAGLQLLDCYADGFREVTSNRAINSMEDFKGLNIRTMENKYHLAFWKELGANPTPLAFGELYIALQQGMLEAQENPMVSNVGAKLVEVQDYVVLTHHIPFVNTYVMNKAQYDALSEEHKELLERFVTGMREETIKGSAAEIQRLMDLSVAEHGVEIIDVPDELRQQIRQANAPVIEQMKKDIDPALVDNFVAAAEAADAQ